MPKQEAPIQFSFLEPSKEQLIIELDEERKAAKMARAVQAVNEALSKSAAVQKEPTPDQAETAPVKTKSEKPIFSEPLTLEEFKALISDRRVLSVTEYFNTATSLWCVVVSLKPEASTILNNYQVKFTRTETGIQTHRSFEKVVEVVEQRTAEGEEAKRISNHWNILEIARQRR